MNKTSFTLLMAFISFTAMAKTNDETAQGAQNFAAFCLSCHNSETSHEARIAPPMIAIQKHYLQDSISEQAFVDAISEFVVNPNQVNSKMPGAVRKYGLMPNMGLSKTQIAPIAKFLYHTTMDEPDWFKSHHQQQTTMSYLQQGQQHALATKAILGKNLMTAIKNQGTEHALAFCNEQAIPLTASMATDRQVKIKRVSDKNRNPENKANAEELQYIIESKKKLMAGKQIKGQVFENNDTVIGYYPIKTNDMCLQCHGLPEQDIATETAAKIKALYPNDLATGYQSNELRGIWVIEMPKKAN